MIDPAQIGEEEDVTMKQESSQHIVRNRVIPSEGLDNSDKLCHQVG